MKKQKLYNFFWIALLLLAVFFSGRAVVKWVTEPGELDGFAQCLADKGVKFYGAFWCPHCQEQKKLFGKSVKKLPYVECSTPDGAGQLQVCKDLKIEGYPTWILPSGERLVPGQNGFSVEKSIGILAEKSQCVLPVK
jgi:thiol-disulfide isomerase/thioredoxin